jgi:hypothetical protein
MKLGGVSHHYAPTCSRLFCLHCENSCERRWLHQSPSTWRVRRERPWGWARCHFPRHIYVFLRSLLAFLFLPVRRMACQALERKAEDRRVGRGTVVHTQRCQESLVAFHVEKSLPLIVRNHFGKWRGVERRQNKEMKQCVNVTTM